MSERKQQIEELVKKIYDNTVLENKTDISVWIEIALKNYFESDFPLDEIEKVITEEIERKRSLHEIMHNHYDKFVLVERIAKSIGNVPSEHIEEILLKNKADLDNITTTQLTEICIAEFKQYRTLDVPIDHTVPMLIEKVLHNDKTKDLLTAILSNEKTLYIHSQYSEDGAYLTHNIAINSEIINFLTKYLIIHREEYEMDELYRRLSNANVNLMDAKELNEFFNSLILSSVQKRLGLEETESLESREQIANFIYNNYVENGYCFQGVNGHYRESILNNGLTSKFSKKEDSRLVIVDDIFKKHGLDKIFFSKLDETNIAPYYYLTDNMGTAYHYSYHNPEWFSYFCATGNNMPDHEYDRTAFYLRDKDSGIVNIEKLCDNYHLSPQEKKYVLEFFNDTWGQIVGDKEENSIVFVQKNLINRNQIPFSLSMVEGKSALEIVQTLTDSYYNIDVQYDSIPKDYIDVIDVPSLNSFYDKKRCNDISKTKFILLDDNSEYIYDILIHADDVDIDCVSIVDDIEPILTSKTTKEGKSIDVIQCSSAINENSVITNGSPSFQTLEMLIAVNGIANSEKGEQLLAKARESYSPAYMSDYYYHLSNFMCDLALAPHIPDEIKATLLIRVAKDIYPKAELMKSTDNYPQYVDENKKLFSYLEYDELLLVEKVESMRESAGPMDSTAIVQLATLFKEKIKGKVNENFSSEFNAKIGDFRTAVATFTTLSSNDDKTISNNNDVGNNTISSTKK